MGISVHSKITVPCFYDGVNADDPALICLQPGENAVTPAQLETLNHNIVFQNQKKNGYITISETPDAEEHSTAESDSGEKKSPRKPK